MVRYMPPPPRKDPLPPPGGRCAAKGCKNQRPAIAVKEGDPFCSTTCARAWYNVEEVKASGT